MLLDLGESLNLLTRQGPFDGLRRSQREPGQGRSARAAPPGRPARPPGSTFSHYGTAPYAGRPPARQGVEPTTICCADGVPSGRQ